MVINESDSGSQEKKGSIESRLESLGYLWVGGDCLAVEDYLLYPGQPTTIDLIAPEGSLPPIDYDKNEVPDLINHLGFSIRSRLAQAGLNGSSTSTSRKGVEVGDDIIVKREVEVLGGRPIKLVQGNGIGSLCSLHGARMLKGPNLYKVIEGGKVNVSGSFGNDWYLAGLGGTYYPDKILGERWLPWQWALFLKLKDKRWQIPVGEEPIDFSQVTDNDYRGYLDQHVLEEIGPERETNFWVGETTSEVSFTPGYTGVINTAANVGQNWVLQSQSLLAKSGTQWPLRTEFYTAPIPPNERIGVKPITPEDYLNQHLVMHLYENLNLEKADNK